MRVGGHWHAGPARGELTRHVSLAMRSLLPAGKHALQGHERCTSMLRHHARATADVGVGARCRGALAAIAERRAATAPTPAGAAGTMHEGHLMIS